MHYPTVLAGALTAFSLVAAHPGHNHEAEQAVRRSYMQQHATRRDLSHCAEKLKARGVERRALLRRQQAAEGLLLRKRAVSNSPMTKTKRDLETLLATDHKNQDAGFTQDTALGDVFAANSSCILSPEVTEGPYYVAGEHIRKDIRDNEPGVDLFMDMQVVDVNTCDPVPSAFLEIWHCNSTGVYSGVSASGNGNSANDKSNLDATYNRGVQQTDADGAAQFQTTFPGHYTGRATHVHIMVHTNATAAANNTLMSTTASHVGQVFFDQSLITQVEATAVYAANTQVLTTNAEDGILAEEASTSHDPFVQYLMLGDSVEDGIFSWISFGVDVSVSKTVNNAATLFAEGGVANANSGAGGPPGGAPGGGRPSSGAPPSGTAASTVAGTAVATAAVTAGAARRRWLA